MNNLIIFATYWNAIDWVETSLKQIDLIDPVEVIICEGCFDLKYPPGSTDGTHEIIAEYVGKRENAKLISPVRTGKISGAARVWLGNEKQTKIRRFYPSRLKAVLRAMMCHHYRINQALTFNKMISLSECWKTGGWFMNYDCDQFYSDEIIKGFSLTNEASEYGQLTAGEYTFFRDANSYTDQYEKRNFNNMPHRIYSNTAIVVTRDIVREGVFGFKYYKETEKQLYLGVYNHYKFADTERFEQGYMVGGRIMPDISSYPLMEYKESHPSIISDRFG